MTRPQHGSWVSVTDFPKYAEGTFKPTLAHSPARSAPQPKRRATIHPDRYWLPAFGAASGLFWAGMLSLIIGIGWWMIVPIIIGALSAAIFVNS